MNTIDTRTETGRSLEQFLRESGERAAGGARFDNESARTLRIDVDGGVWLKPGVAIAHRGELAFERFPTLEAHSVSDVVLREAAPLVRAVGKGRLYCGYHGSHASVVRLSGETIVVSWQDLLAFEESLAFETTLLGHGIGIATGGLFVVRLTGHGAFAIATHGRPLTLAVTRGQPVMTDPHATLAWSDGLTPSLKLDVTWRSALKHGGHEPVQMHFDGDGFVVVQPYEDPRRFKLNVKAIKRTASIAIG